MVLRRPSQPDRPCGVTHSESGEQLITIRRPSTNINLTFHPNGMVTPASWPLSRTELFFPHLLAHYYDVNAEEEHVKLKRYGGNPDGSTGTSMFMLLMYQ